MLRRNRSGRVMQLRVRQTPLDLLVFLLAGLLVLAMVGLGEKFLCRFFDPELDVKFIRDYRPVADGVAQGKYTLAMFVGSAGQDIDRLGDLGITGDYKKLTTQDLSRKLAPAEKGGGPAMIDNYCDCEVPES